MDDRALIHKTEAGREALAKRDDTLNRHERNLLFIVADGRHTAAELRTMVGPENSALLESLIERGFLRVEGVRVPDATPTRDPKARVPELDLPLPARGADQPFDRMYSFLTVQVPHFLGGLGSFTTVLKLEKAATLDDFQPVIEKLLDAVEKKRGRDARHAYEARIEELRRG